MKRVLSLVLCFALLFCATVTSFAEQKKNVNMKDYIYEGEGYIETVSFSLNKQGNLIETHMIQFDDTKEVTIFEVNRDNDKNVVKVYEKGRTISETTYDKKKKELNINENGKISTMTIEEGTPIKNIFEENVDLSISFGDIAASKNIASYSPSYPYLTYLYHPTLKEFGYFHGQYSVTEGSAYHLTISKGTKWSTAISMVLAVVMPGATAVGILIALGVSSIGVTIDFAVSGKVWASFKRLDFEVWSQGYLGKSGYQTEVSQVVLSNTTGRTEKQFLRTEGTQGSISDMIYEGIYNVKVIMGIGL